jgi:hypothetical protein
VHVIDLVKITELLSCSRQTIKGVISLIRFGKGEILVISYPFCGVGLAFRRLFGRGLLIFLTFACWEMNLGEMGFDFGLRVLERI